MEQQRLFHQVPMMGKVYPVLTVEGIALYLQNDGWKFEVKEDHGTFTFQARHEEFKVDFVFSMTTPELEDYFQKTRTGHLWKNPQYQKALFKASLIRLAVGMMNKEGLVKIGSLEA